jgi:hypothetical protein
VGEREGEGIAYAVDQRGVQGVVGDGVYFLISSRDIGYQTKYHLLLGHHLGTTNMVAEFHIQNRVIGSPPNCLSRRHN